MNWLKSFFRREPTRKYFTVYWSKSVTLDAQTIFVDGWEVKTGKVIITQYSERYYADSPETALAMHRSDNPGCTPTSITYFE